MNRVFSLCCVLIFVSCSQVYGQDLSKVNLKRPVSFSGSLSLTLEAYTASGIENRKQPFTWIFAGNPSLNVYGVELPFSFLIGNFENRYYQPFNQFGVSPYYKWVKLHLGYRNVQFSPYTLAGYRMLGAGVELTPGKLRFGFMYGRLNRSTSVDSAQNANPLAYRPRPTYTRMAYAVKLGLGTDRNYFDLSYLKGWDVPGSLDKNAQDSVAPEKNSAVGISWKFTMFKRVTWQTDLGLSLYTNDVNSADALDSTDFAGKDIVAGIVKSNNSTQYLTAAETRLGYQDRVFGLMLGYKRIDPDYRSMGAYFFQNDIVQYTVAPSLRLDSGRLFINGSIGTQEDNLEGLKLSTSKRFIASANISYNPSPKFGLNFSYSNYGITQNPVYISPSSEPFRQVSQNFTLVPYLNLINEHTAQNLQLVASYMLLNNTGAGLNAMADQNSLVGSFLYSRTWLATSITTNLSLNYNSTTLPQGDIGSYGLSLGGSAPVWKNHITVSATAGYNSNFFNGTGNGHTVNLDASASMPVKERHNIQLQVLYLKNTSKDLTAYASFNELTARVVYGLRFKSGQKLF